CAIAGAWIARGQLHADVSGVGAAAAVEWNVEGLSAAHEPGERGRRFRARGILSVSPKKVAIAVVVPAVALLVHVEYAALKTVALHRAARISDVLPAGKDPRSLRIRDVSPAFHHVQHSLGVISDRVGVAAQ